MRIKIDIDKITLDDLIEIEGGKQSLRFTRDFIARFLLDDSGEYMPEDEARRLIGALTVPQIREFSAQIQAEMRGAVEAAVPPKKGGV